MHHDWYSPQEAGIHAKTRSDTFGRVPKRGPEAAFETIFLRGGGGQAIIITFFFFGGGVGR